MSESIYILQRKERLQNAKLVFDPLSFCVGTGDPFSLPLVMNSVTKCPDHFSRWTESERLSSQMMESAIYYFE